MRVPSIAYAICMSTLSTHGRQSIMGQSAIPIRFALEIIMSKKQDLELVFAAIPTSGLKSLWQALSSGRVLRGRFIDGHGNGCLFHWLSETQMIDRPSRVAVDIAEFVLHRIA